MDKYGFQFCQKIVILSADGSKVLLAKRQGELDYDGTYTFIGGKMETTDASILEGLTREKNEEAGAEFKINILPTHSYNVLFTKQNGKQMIIPHYLAVYSSGDFTLSDEYSEAQWVSLDELEDFGPKVPNIPEITRLVAQFQTIVSSEDYRLI